ncbi:MAG TPA: zf-HC2 domain-containing protein [Candidatus Binatia bacterium]
MKHNDENMEKILSSLLSRRRPTEARVGCPDEESLAVYLSGSLADEERDGLERHLAACSYCLSEVAAANEASEPGEKVSVPQWLTERAMALVQAPRAASLFDLVIRFVKDTVEMVQQSGEWMSTLAPQPAAVRGAAKPASRGLLQVERQMGAHKIALEVEKTDGGGCQVIVRVTGEDGKPVDGVRLSLKAGEREQASFLTRQGQAVFESVPEGEYDLILSLAAATLGTIRLKIVGSHERL